MTQEFDFTFQLALEDYLVDCGLTPEAAEIKAIDFCNIQNKMLLSARSRFSCLDAKMTHAKRLLSDSH